MPEPMDGASDVSNNAEGEMSSSAPENTQMDTPMDNSNEQLPPIEDDNMVNMDGNNEMPTDDMMGGEPASDEEDDSTISIVNQLSPDDKEAVRSYAESLLKRSEPSQEEQQEDERQPMMETMTIKKGDMETLLETIVPSQDELFMTSDKNKPLNKKAKKNISSNSPFSAPKFEEK